MLLQIVTTLADAFQFDTWTSGMSIREAMAIARDKDIPLVKEGLISISKRFHPDASVKYVDSAHNFYYIIKGTGYFSLRSVDLAGAAYFRGRTFPPFQLASLRSRMAFADSSIHVP